MRFSASLRKAIVRSVTLLLFLPFFTHGAHAGDARLAYLVSDARIPFWSIMAMGIRYEAQALGYSVAVYSADNDAKSELEHAVAAIESGVMGIILSPTNSSAAVTILRLAEQAQVPVVIADIGAGDTNYVSYIESDNDQGAYDLGRILASTLKDKDWEQGTVGIIAIPQKRANGKVRTEGFLRALAETGIKAAGIFQQSDFSYQETYDFSRALISEHPTLRAIWLQGSDRYEGALDAIADAGKEGQILLICFDAEPRFVELIGQGQIIGAGMQQPFLMGQKSIETMHLHLSGIAVEKNQQVAVLPVSKKNLDQLLPIINRNVFGKGMVD